MYTYYLMGPAGGGGGSSGPARTLPTKVNSLLRYETLFPDTDAINAAAAAAAAAASAAAAAAAAAAARSAEPSAFSLLGQPLMKTLKSFSIALPVRFPAFEAKNPTLVQPIRRIAPLDIPHIETPPGGSLRTDDSTSHPGDDSTTFCGDAFVGDANGQIMCVGSSRGTTREVDRAKFIGCVFTLLHR